MYGVPKDAISSWGFDSPIRSRANGGKSECPKSCCAGLHVLAPGSLTGLAEQIHDESCPALQPGPLPRGRITGA